MGETILKAKNELQKHKEKFKKVHLQRIVALEIPKYHDLQLTILQLPTI